MKAAAILVGVLVSLSAASEESTDRPQEPSVEILGVKIVRGMPESEVRASLPNVYCAEKAPGVAPGMTAQRSRTIPARPNPEYQSVGSGMFP